VPLDRDVEVPLRLLVRRGALLAYYLQQMLQVVSHDCILTSAKAEVPGSAAAEFTPATPPDPA